MINVFLLLGSNLGNRQSFLEQAILAIEKKVGVVKQRSSVYETQSWGRCTEPDYLNQVVLVQTNQPARQILNEILDIEQALGRQRSEKWGSRTLDIDILFYDNEIINEPDLIVPHPELQNRRFTLEPLVELVSDFEHPVLKKSVLELKNELKDTLNIKKLYL